MKNQIPTTLYGCLRKNVGKKLLFAVFLTTHLTAFDQEAEQEKKEKFHVGGSLVQSATFNPERPADGYNGVTTWTDRANEYQLNQAWTYLEVPTDIKSKKFDWGGRIDLLFGSSYRWAVSEGFENKFKTNNGDGGLASGQYGLAIPAVYFDAAYRALKLRVGHIISPVGFFTIDTTQNVFSSLPYTYQYGEPFTHTGAFVYWEASNKLTLSSGVTTGSDNWINGSGMGSKKPDFLGTLSYVFGDASSVDWVVHISEEYNYKDSSNSTSQGVVDADNGIFTSPDIYSWRYFQTLVYKRNLASKLQWVLQTDLGIQKVADVKAAAGGTMDATTTAMWYGANTYLIYQALQSLQIALNFEWFRDSAGVRVAHTPGNASLARAGGTAVPLGGQRKNYIGDFFQIAFGPKWQPYKNFFVRLEGRFDVFTGDALNDSSATPALPWGDGKKRNQFIACLDMAFTF